MAIQKYIYQFYSFDFLKGLVLTIALSLPLYLGIAYGMEQWGIAFALGAFYTFLPNIDGSHKHRIGGIVAALILALIITFLSFISRSISVSAFWVFFSLCVFGVSLLSVYGFRASMVAFSGHFALIMSFALLKSDLGIDVKLLLICGGGLWYLILASLSHKIFENRGAEQNLADCIELTADYLKVKHQLLWNETEPLLGLEQRMNSIQVALNEKHELLRELLYEKRQNEGQSNRANRQLLIFLELLDVYEFALAINTDFNALEEQIPNHLHVASVFKELSARSVVHLYALSEALHKGTPLPLDAESTDMKILCEETIQSYVSEVGLPAAREGALMLRNLLDYEYSQWQKVFSAKKIFGNILEGSEDLLKRSDRSKFIPSQDYDFKTLKAHFTLKSSVFRHALRLTVAMLIGLWFGQFFVHQNAYWILLTIAVILRPNFGLTKKRAVQRIYGTLVGAAMASFVLLLFDSKTLFGFLAVPSIFVAFVFLQKNYRIAATFITMAILFFYGVLVDNTFEIIKYRVLDTLIGAVIAFLSVYLLWPSWEQSNLRETISKAYLACNKYLLQINELYTSKTTPSTGYLLARKQAFLDNGNLMAGFQRLTEQPKSKQENVSQLYAAVVLNQTFLNALAALGLYIRNHETSAPSKEFEVIINEISQNLTIAGAAFSGQLVKSKPEINESSAAIERLDEKYADLERIRNKELENGYRPLSTEMQAKLQEGKMIREHLKWLLGLSKNIREVVS
ncbi:MAG: putative membrane protein YccC [Arcticibacterium sp.]|jgi:uncharacterized membrane protein YccC